MTQILMLLVWLIVALILLLKQNQLQKQLYHLLGFNASLRMRVFEQELRQLEAPGIFIHEDTAQILAGIVLAFLTQEQKAELEKAYKQRCSPHVPFWKFFLYEYTFGLNVTSRFESGVLTSVPQIYLNEVSRILAQAKTLEKSLSELASLTEEANKERPATSKAQS